jgi:DNA-binding LytR/AlgR family response regulator
MKAIIIEDEKLVARELVAKIVEIDNSIEVLEILGSLKTALRWFAENAEPDIIFADIQLSDGVSFEVFKKFKMTCPIIFTTAYNEYAIQAFKVNSVDYLLKPVNRTELKIAIDKAKGVSNKPQNVPFDIQKLMEALNLSVSPKKNYKEQFLGSIRNSQVPIKISDVAYFTRHELNYMITFENEKYILDFTTLDEVEELLDPNQFYRANRQFIINIGSIQSVQNSINSKLILRLKKPHNNVEIDISREKAPTFKKWLDR